MEQFMLFLRSFFCVFFFSLSSYSFFITWSCIYQKFSVHEKTKKQKKKRHSLMLYTNLLSQLQKLVFYTQRPLIAAHSERSRDHSTIISYVTEHALTSIAQFLVMVAYVQATFKAPFFGCSYSGNPSLVNFKTIAVGTETQSTL